MGSFGKNEGAAWAGMRWWLAGLCLALLVVLVLPARQVRLAGAELRGLVGSYLYGVYTPVPPVECLRVSDLRLSPKQLRVEWDYTLWPVAYYEVYRGGTPLGTTQNTYFDDAFDYAFDTTYTYSVVVVPDNGGNGGLGEPPPGADPGDIFYGGSPSDPAYLPVVIAKANASENQAADTRLDLRFGQPTLQDFAFGSRTYRGGLFAGYAADPSRVGRSYLKFQLPSFATDARFFTGTVNAYHTRSFASGSTEVGCQLISDSWSAAALKWSTAPSMDPPNAPRSAVLSWNSANPTSSWARWEFGADIEAALTGDGVFSVGLASKDEGAAGWAYFAKKEWDAQYAPCVLFAYEPGGAPLAPSSLAATAASSTQINLSWTDQSSDETGFRIERKSGAGSWTFVNTAAANATSYADTGLASGTAYTYRVRAGKNCAYSRWSNEATATTP